jgi:AraC-like DNA-binding protein
MTGYSDSCGVLAHADIQFPFRHTRVPALTSLSEWVEHFWIEEWDVGLCGPQHRVMLAHPCVNLVFAQGRSRIYGVQRRRFLRDLKGHDRIVGIRFHPGAFYSFFRKPVVQLADSSIPAIEVFDDAMQVERRILSNVDDAATIAAASEFLMAHLPLPDANAHTAREIVNFIATERSVTQVSYVVSKFGFNHRSLQRLFFRYVGASPRWVISHYRIHEVLKRLDAGESIVWASLAQTLGYFDQAHLINDFVRFVGRSPTVYANNGA